MNIHWASLVAVFAVSLCSTVAVVMLVSLAMVGLSARTAPSTTARVATRNSLFSPWTGTVIAGACLAAATLIVLFGLWTLVTR